MGNFFFSSAEAAVSVTMKKKNNEHKMEREREREKESQALHKKLHTLLVVNFFFEYFILEKNK